MATVTTHQMAYDHPAYLVPESFIFGQGTAPSGAVTTRQTVYANMIAKAAHLSVAITGTNTSTVSLLRLVSTNTTTTTLASMIIGTGIVAGTSIGTSVGQYAAFGCGTTTLNAGDQVWAVNGVDISVGWAVTAECYIVPGASLTA